MRIPWHHLFSSLLDDYLTNTPLQVEPEVELSVKRQFLDVAIVVPTPHKPPDSSTMCDGFEHMANHNLLTFKSFQESLTSFCLSELTSYYVAYCKQRGLLNKTERENVRLFAVCGRRPIKLMRERPCWELKPGIFKTPGIEEDITLIVPNLVSVIPRNAFWLLFSADPERVHFACRHYRLKRQRNESIMMRVVNRCAKGVSMYDIEAIRKACDEEMAAKNTIITFLRKLASVKNLDDISSDELFEGFPIEKRLEGLSYEELRAHLDKMRPND